MSDGYPSCFGPYLRYAISTGFAGFASFDEAKQFRLFLLIEFKRPGCGPAFVADLDAALAATGGSAAPPHVVLGPAKDHAPYATLRAPAIAVTAATPGSPVSAVWDGAVSRVELSLPMKPAVRGAQFRRLLGVAHGEDETPPKKLLIGVMDDGCPFAAAQFLRVTNGLTTTRVKALWDQNHDRSPIAVVDGSGTTRYFGHPPDFLYGLEFRRDPTMHDQIGLDEWRAMHATPAGFTDEDSCYRDADFRRLASQRSHGAHILDVCAGRVPVSARMSANPDNPPSFEPSAPATDPAADADIVFVQFSDDCLRDASGVWLKSYVLDGIRYIMSFADPNQIKSVIINLSYGPTIGPHDGSDELEQALIALVSEYDGSDGNPTLEIAIPAGNSYLTAGHVAFARKQEHIDRVSWTWRVLPDNTAISFAEIWVSNADASAVTVTLTSPSGLSSPVGALVWGSSTMWRLDVGPTVSAPLVAASEHGDYTIEVSHLSVGAQVHAYVARTDPNMGVVTGAKHSYFVDPEWERRRSAEANCKWVDGEFDLAGSLISRFGTLNGLGTEKHPRVHEAGGYIFTNGRKSPYSSAGPARKGPREGPDYVLPTDESYALQGIRAGGNRTGATFRLIGTSVGAPQLARQFAKVAAGMTFPTPTLVPPPTDLPGIARRGGGDVAPP